MKELIPNVLILHILSGCIALISGAIAIAGQKGKSLHLRSGKIYFWAMTAVFVTGIIIAGYKFNRFLFLIAFLSYYSVFAGVRFLKLKNLHKSQSAKWYDWLAGGINTVANLIFVGLGLYYYLIENKHTAAVLLTLGFGLGGLLISYTNLKPFIIRPDKSYHWYLAHIGNMMGGYIATFTAFLSVMVSKYEFMNPFLAFALPSLIGIPLLVFWQNKLNQKFSKA